MATDLISVIVCTYNRSQSLRETLGHLRAQETSGFDTEIVVVDNHSRDDTRAVVESLAPSFGGRLRYVYEARQGKPYALNTGVEAARGRLLAFTDDDVHPDQRWLRRLASAFEGFGADCVYGKVLPLWLGERPAWLSTYFLLRLGLLDYGDEPFLASSAQHLFIGANVALTREALIRMGPFNVNLGNQGRRMGGEEDTDLFERLLAAGARIAYAPDAVVYHNVPPERLRLGYFRKWHFDHGLVSAYVTPCEPGQGILGVPFWAIRKFLTHVQGYLIGVFVGDRERRLANEMRIIGDLGLFIEKGKLRGEGRIDGSDTA